MGPANTLNYFIFGYVVFFTVMIAYIASLFLRDRNLKQDIETLEELEKKE